MNSLHDGCTHRNWGLVLEYKGHRERGSIASGDWMEPSLLHTVQHVVRGEREGGREREGENHGGHGFK